MAIFTCNHGNTHPEVMHCKFALCFRYNNANNDVVVFQISNDLPLGQNVSFQYKATTVSNLLPSIFVSSPVYLYYVTLPPSLAPQEGRKYEENSNQVFFLNCAMAVDSLLMNNSRMLHAWVWMGGGGYSTILPVTSYMPNALKNCMTRPENVCVG